MLVRSRLWAAGCQAVVTSRAAPGCIADLYPGRGPLGGIHAVLRSRPAVDYLVVPVDMPLLSVALLRGLIAAGRSSAMARAKSSRPAATVMSAG